jgi:hypothetical protein
MKRRFSKKTVGSITAICIVLALSLPLAATHTIDLITPNSIPCFCQEAGNWCGAATSQMILQGYPGGVDYTFTQNHVWNRIQVHNGDAIAWASDPLGVQGTLMELDGSAPANWSIFHDANRSAVMYDITYWMTRRSFPTAVLVRTHGAFGSFDHWVVITGFTTDNDPVTHSSVTLQWIEIFDPGKSPCPTASAGGNHQLMTAATWHSVYWPVPGNAPGSLWDGEYVAVVEPPITEGVVYAPEQKLGPVRISPEEALEVAFAWVKENSFEKREVYAGLRRAVPFPPLLVDPEAEFGGAYFIVPFGMEGLREATNAVLVNAHTGEPQEIVAFGHPVSYIHEDEALEIARRHLCLCREEEIKSELYFAVFPSSGTFSRFLPVWRVEFRYPIQSVIFVTQQGIALEELPEPVLGD